MEPLFFAFNYLYIKKKPTNKTVVFIQRNNNNKTSNTKKNIIAHKMNQLII